MPSEAYLNFYYENTGIINALTENCLKITSLEDNNAIAIERIDGFQSPVALCEYSLDNGLTWHAGRSWILNTGQSIMFKGTNAPNTYKITSEGKFNASGNPISIIDPTKFNLTTLDDEHYSNLFRRMFYRSKIVDASRLKLPFTTLSSGCYDGMFYWCDDLIAAPSLPATTLADHCYSQMFRSCDSLVNAPKLPATTLATYCYNEMFANSDSLQTAPELPATTLADHCYYKMFSDCESLINAPQLPATTLADNCYYEMFKGCTALEVPPQLPATTLADNCYYSMFSGCTHLANAPALPATTLTNHCYRNMFSGCTSLYTAPVLPATTLTDYCYYNMFNGCSHLNYIKILATNYDGAAGHSIEAWVTNVAPSGTFVKDASSNYLINSNNGVPIGWTVYDVDSIPETYTVTLNAIQPAYGTVTGAGTYVEGTLLTIMAFPVLGFRFEGWYSGNTLVSEDQAYTFTVTEDITLDAHFTNRPVEQYTVTLSQDPDIGATLTGAGTYNSGSTVIVTASNVQDYIFIGWSLNGTIVSTELIYTFTLISNVSLVAIYESGTVYYTLTLNNDTPSAGTVTGAGVYPAGMDVTITATPNANATFVNWMYNGEIYSTNATETVTMNDNITLTAVFSADNYHTYFTIESVEDGNDISFENGSKVWDAGGNASYLAETTFYYEYSVNNDSWTRVTQSGASKILAKLNRGDFICFRKVTHGSLPANVNVTTYAFNASKNYKVYGNIMSLLNNHWSDGSTNDYYYGINLSTLSEGEQFNSIFANRYENYGHITDASGLVLPATTLSTGCYNAMFVGQTLLTSTGLPTLPATTLADHCYYQMFAGCTALTSAPAMPATTLAPYCYELMFFRCTALTSAPALPATTLANYCYSNMFNECTALVNTPTLSATTLAEGCYNSMFNSCSRLTTAPALPATTLAKGCYSSMFVNCTLLVNAPTLSATTLAEECYNSMFISCPSLVNAPALPATTLAKGCYMYMFMNCRLLTTAPTLPATTLAEHCYESMFEQCLSLNNITCSATDISADCSTMRWVQDVSSTGTFTKASSMTNWTRGNSGIPVNWTVQNAS